MPTFTHKCANLLNACDGKLISIFREIIKEYDFRVLCGHRNEAEQNAAFKAGNTKLQWPHSKHNSLPSKAVDILPACLIVNGKIDWNDKKEFDRAYSELAELVYKEADKQKIHIRWGGDFHMDGSKTKNDNWDKPHFELA